MEGCQRSRGWSVRNLEYCRTFYLEYPILLDREKSNALRSISASASISPADDPLVLTDAECSPSWQPGPLHPNLSWIQYH